MTVKEYLLQNKSLDEFTDDELRHADWIVKCDFIDMNRRGHTSWYHPSEIESVDSDIIGLNWKTMEKCGYVESKNKKGKKKDGAIIKEFNRRAAMGENVVAYRYKFKPWFDC